MSAMKLLRGSFGVLSVCCLFLSGWGGGEARALSSVPAGMDPINVVTALPRAERPPVIDGRIEAEEWGQAAALTGVTLGGKVAECQSVFYLQWRPDALFLAARSYFAPGIKVRRRTQQDSPSLSDSLEMAFYAPEPGAQDPLHCHCFVFPDGSPAWLEFFSVASHEFIRSNVPTGSEIGNASRFIQDPDQTLGPGTMLWDAEVRVPLAAMLRREPFREGDTLGLLLARNFGFTRPEAADSIMAQAFIPVTQGFFEPAGFVQARLVATGPVVRFTDVLPLLRGTGGVALAVRNPGPEPAEIQVSHAFAKDAAVQTVTVGLPAGAERIVELAAAGTNQNVCRMEVATVGGDCRFRYAAPFALQAARTAEKTAEADSRLERLVCAMEDGLYISRRLPSGVEASERLTYRRGAGSTPRLSPSSDRVLLTSAEGGKSGIWLLEDEGRKQRRLADGRDASWLPDGTGLVYERDGRLYRLDLADAAAAKSRDITPRGLSACRFPVAAADRLAFVVEGRALHCSALDGGGDKTLANGELLGPPAWSPDGRWLTFQDGPHLWMVDGEGDRRLAVGGVGIKSGPFWDAEGRGLAACYASCAGAPLQIRTFPLGCTDVAAGGILLPQVFSAGDGVWHFEKPPASAVPADAPAPPADGTLLLGRTTGGDVTLAGLGSNPGAVVDRRPGGCRINALDGKRTVSVSGPLARLILVDRLGRDIAVAPREAPVQLDFAPLLVCLAGDGGGALVVANPAGSAGIEARWREGRWTLFFGRSSGGIAVGYADGEGGAVWLDPAAPGAAGPPVSGVWRFVGGEGASPAAAIGVPAAGEKRLAYFYARADPSPLRGFSVSDVVQSLCGLTGPEHEAVLQDEACASFRIAARPTLYPTMGRYLEVIGVVRNKDMDYMNALKKDRPDLCADAEGILEEMDRRLDEYAAAAGRLALPELAGLLEGRAGFVTSAALKAARADLIRDGRLDANAYVETGRKAAEQREQLLKRCREQAVALRTSAGAACLDQAEPGQRAAAVARWREVGALLARRHEAEGWLGEPGAPRIKVRKWSYQ